MAKITACFQRNTRFVRACRFYTVAYLIISSGCNSKISSKLAATKVIVPSSQGSEFAKEGMTVSVQQGTFADSVEMEVEPTMGGIDISTISKNGAKVVSSDVLLDVHFCSVIDPGYDLSNVYVFVKITEDQSGRTDTIPNSAIEFSEANGQPQGCWFSKYVNASFLIMVKAAATVGGKGSDPNCIDPNLSVLSKNEALTLCDGTIARGTLDLTNLHAENLKAGVVLGGVLGVLIPSPDKCANDGALGCVTSATFPAVDKRLVTATDIRVGKTIGGIAGTYIPDFPEASNVYNDTVNGIAGTLTLPSASNVRVVNGSFGPAGAAVAPSLGDCNSDGAIGCVAVAGFKSADMSQVMPINIKSGITIAGIGGNIVDNAPPCGSDGGILCVVDGTTYKAAAIAGLAAKVLNGETVAGVGGNITMPAVGKVLVGTQFGVSGTGLSGTLTLPAAANVLAANGAFGDSAAATTPLLTLPDVGDVYAGIAFGVGGNGSLGTLTLPSVANVRASNGAFGRSGNSSTPLLADCSVDGGISCVAVPTFKAADMTHVVAGNIKNAVTIAAVTGTVVSAPANCAADGATSCVAVADFPAVDKVNNITANVAKIRDSVTIVGVAGTLSDCAEGASGCVAIGPLQAAATVAGAASKILSGQAVAGISGNVTLPAVGNVLTGIQYGVSANGQTGTLTLPLASNVLAGSSPYGDPGAAVTPSFSPDYPAVGNVLSSDTVNSAQGTLTLPAAGEVYTGIAYGVGGNSLTGTLTLASAANVRTGNGAFGRNGSSVTPLLSDCSIDGGTGCVAVADFKAADMTNAVAGKIRSGATIAGISGDYPSVANPLDGADGTADLVLATFDAKIKGATNFEWFDSSGQRYVNSGDADIVETNISSTANIFGTQGTVSAPTTPNAWDIRAGKTINGVTGQLKVACRNSADATVFDAGEFRTATADSSTDVFTVAAHGYADNDIIRFGYGDLPYPVSPLFQDYYVISSTANTFKIATESGGAAINLTTNGNNFVVYRWGDGVRDIWDTVDEFNNGGADFTAASIPAAWTADNFCGGIGSAASSAVWTDTTADGTCDSAGDECRFKDKISGLEWSELLPSVNWANAITTCANLSFGGEVDWRLPTQKELMAAYEHGIYSASTENWLTKAQMVADYIWSSSSVSGYTGHAYFLSLDTGHTSDTVKVDEFPILCVR